MAVSRPIPTVDVPGLPRPLTRAVLGTMSFGDTADAQRTQEIFEAAMDAGITGVDTANGYALGTTESLISPLVQKFRDRIILATKAGMPHPDAGEHAPLSAKGLRLSVEGSLRRLGVDSVDIFYLHQPDRATSLDETLSTVAALQSEGKIGALGISNYAAWQGVDVEAAALRAGATPPVIGQNVYNLVARRIEDEWVEYASAHGVLTMCYNPLAGGLLVAPPEDGAPSRFNESSLAEMYKKRYWSPELLAAVRAIAGIAADAGLAMPQLGIRWLVSQPGAGAILLGGDRVEHVMSNLAAILEGPLDEDVLAACAAVSDPLKGAMPAYNR